jgi:hypothetical protein
MPNGEQPIDAYITQIGRRLHLPEAERDQVLTEVRSHLEERAAALQETGTSPEQAERQAVAAFGPVTRISRGLRAAHPRPWGPVRWIVGIVTGAVVTWGLWLAGTVPVMIYYFTVLYPVYQCQGLPTNWTPPLSNYCYPGSPYAHPMPPNWSALLLDSSPGGRNAFYAYLTFGWLWVLPLLVLYLVLPFLWGRRAQRWWVPGLAYGLGAWLSAPWFIWEVAHSDWGFSAYSAEGRIIALALPLALVASCAGWFWRKWSASALSRVVAA